MIRNRKVKLSLLKRLIISIVFLTLTVGLTACGAEPAFTSEGKIKVTATIGMITDVVKQVGGQHVEAIGLMKSGVDPHIWFDVRLWMTAAETIRDELVKLDPAHQDDYRRNANAYLKKLQELHEYAKTQIASIPRQGRVLVTAHDAFGYFGDAYDIRVSGLQGISTASEAGIKDVGDLRDFLVQNKIKAVFVESSVPRKTIQAVVDGAREKGHNATIGGELFSDAMGEEGTEQGTYIGMVKHNVDTLVKASK